MKRQLLREKRRRETDSEVLQALSALVGENADSSAVRAYLAQFASVVTPSEDAVGEETVDAGKGIESADLFIHGKGLTKLCHALGMKGDDAINCAIALAQLTKRVPRSRSSPTYLSVAELTFLMSQFTGPVGVRERRKAFVGGEIAEDSPLLLNYKGEEFARICQIPSTDEGRISEEWSSFVKTLGSPLPMTLRVHHNEKAMEAVALDVLTNHERVGGRAVAAELLERVPFLPRGLDAFSCSHELYHSHSDLEYECRTLHSATAVSFQEAVSMIPVLALDVQPHHAVLDMCAAPGSKTLQALDEMLSGGWDGCRCGVLIASEKDRTKATQTLPSRLKRFHAPNVIVTRCDGTQWPQLYRPTAADGSFEARRFDRIICDVPCSGDGTARKEPSVLSTWSPVYVESLVPTQKALLRRGLDLLEVGGILVYSTCSMNVKEDEEVVCAALSLFSDSVCLIDVNEVLRTKVEQGAAAANSSAAGAMTALLSRGGVSADSLGEAGHALYDGSKVLRVLPHRNDTGGFFVAAFRKVAMPKWSVPVQVSNKLNQWMQHRRWHPVPAGDEEWTGILKFFGIAESAFSHPTVAGSLTATSGATSPSLEVLPPVSPVFHVNPNGGPARRIVFVTDGVYDSLFRCRPYKGPGLEIVSAGVRAFEKYDGTYLADAACRWRAVVEGASCVAPLATRRKVHVDCGSSKDWAVPLLRSGSIPLSQWISAVVAGGQDAAQQVVDQGVLQRNPSNDAAAMNDLTPLVGCVLLCLHGGVSPLTEQNGWWVSATVSATKLELAIDISLRQYGLLAFFGLKENLGATAS